MTEFRQVVVLAILAFAMVAVALGIWRFGPDLVHPPTSVAPDNVAEARETVAPLYVADANETAVRITSGGVGLSMAAVQVLLFAGVLNVVFQFGKWVFARRPVAELAEPALVAVAIVGLAVAFVTLGPSIARLVGGALAVVATLGASEGQSFATAAAGEGILPSDLMVAWVQRVVAWVGEAGADPGSWAYLGCAFVSVVVLGIVLGVSFLIYAELLLVSFAGIVVLGFEDVKAPGERQDSSPSPAARFGAAEAPGAARRYLTSVFAKGVKLMTLLLAVDATGRISREIGQATGAGALEDALSLVLLQIAFVMVILVLPAALERRVVLGVGS